MLLPRGGWTLRRPTSLGAEMSSMSRMTILGGAVLEDHRPLAAHVALAAGFLFGEPPAAGLLGVFGVLEVEDAVDAPLVAFGSGGEVGVAPAVIEITVGAGLPGLPVGDAPGDGGVGGDVPDVDALGLGGIVGPGTPAGGDFFQRCDQQAVGGLDLEGPGVVGSGEPGLELGGGGVGHVEDGPAALPEGGEVEIETAPRLLHGDLEGRTLFEIVVADEFDVLGRDDRGRVRCAHFLSILSAGLNGGGRSGAALGS